LIRYLAVARKLVRHGYAIADDCVLTVAELLELAGDEAELEHVLHDDPVKQAARLRALDEGLGKVLAEYEKKRLRCPLLRSSVSGSYRPAFCSRPGPDPDNVVEDQVRVARFRLAPAFAELLFRLTPRQFEQLCAEVLRSVGCQSITVSQASKDDGVDALAALPMSEALADHTPLHRLAGSMSFLVYAQAKRYSRDRPVEQDEVFEVQGSWTAMRHGFANGTLPPEVRSALLRADYRSADPVFLILLTTSRFTAGSEAKADTLGVLLLDGEQIAQLLIERDYGLSQPIGDEWELDEVAIVAELTAAG
jgi:hypothetical protein